VEIFEQAAAAEETEGDAAAAGKIEGVTVAAEFATDDNSLEVLVDDPSNNINNDQTLQGSGLPDNSMDVQMESTAGELQLEAGDGKLKANNNLYFKFPTSENYQIGRLTYMAGTIYGSIAECNIYTSSDESVGYDPSKGPEYITNWEKVYLESRWERPNTWTATAMWLIWRETPLRPGVRTFPARRDGRTLMLRYLTR